jgi:hypothetical protein
MWVPPKYVQAREEFEHEMRQRVAYGELERVKGILDEFNHELRRIDDKLEMVRAPADCGLTGMKPHYYHVVRWNEGAPPTFIVVEGENGEFVEPTSRVFEKLKAGDLWDPANMRRIRQRHANAEAAAAKLRERENAARREELADQACCVGDQDAGLDEPGYAVAAQNHAGTKRRHRPKAA